MFPEDLKTIHIGPGAASRSRVTIIFAPDQKQVVWIIAIRNIKRETTKKQNQESLNHETIIDHCQRFGPHRRRGARQRLFNAVGTASGFGFRHRAT
jgi:hypothetical protein